jgi:cytoskeletal protein CcmA (bactofilin family)
MVARTRRKWIVGLILLVISFTGVASRVEAADGMRGDHCVVEEKDYIVEDFYFMCRVLEVKGTIVGDLLGVASNITITSTGVVTGDLWVGGGKLVIDGTVGDDVHFAGISLFVSSKARFTNDRIDVVSAAFNTEIRQGATVPGDLLAYGYQVKVDGTVGGDVDYNGEALIIRGTIMGRVDASVGDPRRHADIPGLPIYDVSFTDPGLRIAESAHIGGNLTYKSPGEGQIPPGVVAGRIKYQAIMSQPDITKAKQTSAAARIMASYLVSSLRDVLTLMIVGVIGLRVTPNFVRQPALHIRRSTIPTVGWGLVAFMLSFPVAIMLIVISLIILGVLISIKLSELTIVAAVGLVVINLALIGGFWFLLLFMGRVVVSFVIGQLIYRYALRSPDPGGMGRWIATLAVGSAVYALVTNVPVPALGLTLELITALAGMGAVVMYLRGMVYLSERFTLRQAAVPHFGSLPPLFEGMESMPGMDNLPEGFTGFDEDW